MKHVRRRDIDLEKAWDVESATGKGVVYVTKSKNESSERVIPLNQAAREAVERMLKRANALVTPIQTITSGVPVSTTNSTRRCRRASGPTPGAH